ncbi:UNVERIFIED_CONTAM: hypothetical protein RKD50_009189 [Streptomyces canus]
METERHAHIDQPDGLDTVSVDDAARVNGWAGTEGLAMRPIIQL